MAHQTKEDKRIDKAIDDAFKKHGNNVQIPMLDLGKILDAGRKAGKEGKDIESAVKEAIEIFRVK